MYFALFVTEGFITGWYCFRIAFKLVSKHQRSIWKRAGRKNISERIRLKGAKAELQKYSESLTTLQGEVVNAIQGTSKFEPELLNELIIQTKAKFETTSAEVDRLELDLENKQQYFMATQANYEKLISWSEIFRDANIETKKMITAYLIESVKVGRGYELEMKFNVAFEQFFSTT